MVFVKVRETYDLHTLKGKMSVIGIHTPSDSIIARNYPGLLMQCKAYRPVKADVRLACASVLPLDPQGVGTTADDVAPEDVFNPILYKALSNFGMSQIDAYVNSAGYDIIGNTLDASNTGIDATDDFDLYYGLLSQTHEWKHANPQQGLMMNDLVPLVYETYQSIGDNGRGGADNPHVAIKPDDTIPTGQIGNISVQTFRGKAHPIPFLNCTVPVANSGNVDTRQNGFIGSGYPNAQVGIPAPKIYCAAILVPPSRLHQLFFRMVCEWTLEFSMIRPLGEITSWAGLKQMGSTSHFMSYDYSAESKDTVFKDVTDLVDVTQDSGIKKVM
ncbi:putative capsid protein [Sheep faeces associated smacovirus 3]|uniref:Putative capsid protein n=1 Tax=Sheep faeces associated smacovirus 3 TaxID=1843758 RepID=A0A160HWG5_9VIRU|nr:putative capsid protein [Sheep faeces associated smacovirus 3]ANC51525.1 putative capsid protein [Sheep faeces associated smacovirus 3]